MTEFEKLLSKYTDIEQFYTTVGFYHIASRASEIETRKLIDVIVEREGIADDLQAHKDYTRTSYTTADNMHLGYAIPRFYYHEKDGNIEANKVEVLWYSCDFEDVKFSYPINEKETVIPITEAEEQHLIDLSRLARDARNDFEAVRRTAVNNLFKENGITTDYWKGDDDLKQKLAIVRDLADKSVEAVTMQDAERLQEIQYKEITQHWQIVGNTDADTRNELIRLFCTQRYDTDEKSKAKQLACVYSNFANNVVTAIPEGYVHDKFIICHGKKDRSDADLENYTLVKNCLDGNREKILELSQAWYYEVGGEYVKDETETPAESEINLQRFAESEAIIQDYTSPKQQIYSLTKASRGIFDDPALAEEITLLDDGQLEFKFAVSKADAKTQRAVVLDIADKVKGLTKFDKSVYNAVLSTIEAGNTTFTSKQVAIQNTQNTKPTSNTIGAYTKSIDKMQGIIHKIDATDHYRQNGNLDETDIKKVEQTGYLLPVEGIVITMNNGTKVNGYRLIKTPILLEYAKKVKQIHTVDNEVLSVPVRLDEKTLLIRDYLIQQIGIIYNSHSKVSNNILINTVLDYAGIDLVGLDRTQRKRHTDKIKEMLQYWNGEHIDGVEPIKNKYIEYGYKLQYNGKTLEAITINPRPKTGKN